MPAKHKKIKLQLAGQQTLPFVRKYIVTHDLKKYQFML
jgi:hypothetical protein